MGSAKRGSKTGEIREKWGHSAQPGYYAMLFSLLDSFFPAGVVRWKSHFSAFSRVKEDAAHLRSTMDNPVFFFPVKPRRRPTDTLCGGAGGGEGGERGSLLRRREREKEREREIGEGDISTLRLS